MNQRDNRQQSKPEPQDRRSLLGGMSRAAMAAGLVAGYGAFAAVIARFVYPSEKNNLGWLMVAPVDEIPVGAALTYRTPLGATINVARQGQTGSVEDFVALSSTCPHLGCQVHWQPLQDRFFCPCHNGVFTPGGAGIGGPPGEAGQSLPRYPLKVQEGLLFIQVAVEEARHGRGRLLRRSEPDYRAGHDPCLQRRA